MCGGGAPCCAHVQLSVSVHVMPVLSCPQHLVGGIGTYTVFLLDTTARLAIGREGGVGCHWMG